MNDPDPIDATVPKRQVRQRRVFYIPGYDPIHPRRYRELYRTEGAAQAGISGYDLSLRPKAKGAGPYGWHVRATIDGHAVEAEVEVLVWSDIVRHSMSNSIAATYLQLVRTAWTYIASGALRRLMWLRKGPVIAALYPVGMLLLQLMLAGVAGLMAGRVVIWAAGQIAAFVGSLPGWVAPFLFWPVFVVVLVSVLRWFKARDGRFFAYYLMQDYAFSA